jgi:hypothetical protein
VFLACPSAESSSRFFCTAFTPSTTNAMPAAAMAAFCAHIGARLDQNRGQSQLLKTTQSRAFWLICHRYCCGSNKMLLFSRVLLLDRSLQQAGA